MKSTEDAGFVALEKKPTISKNDAQRLKKGEAFEKVAFSLCKIALFCLLTQTFALPLASLGAALFFGLAIWNGKQDTKCWAKNPILIAIFWFLVAGIWFLVHLHLVTLPRVGLALN